MSKVLTDVEALETLASAVNGTEIDCADAYKAFLEDLGRLIADHFGGELVCVSSPLGTGLPAEPIDDNAYCLHFKYNENVPEDGGIYARYDTDVSIEEWKGGD